MDRFVVSLVDDRNNVVAQRTGCSIKQVPDAILHAMGGARVALLLVGWKIVIMRDETLNNEHFTPDELERAKAGRLV